MSYSVLILEDSRTQAVIIGKLFERAGFTPAHAFSKDETIQQLKKQRWDLLVLDVFVEADNTLDHLDIFRVLAAQTPIAVMTAGRRDNPLAASHALNKARRDKVDFLLPKPFNFEDIQQICEDTVRLNANRRAASDPDEDPAFYL